MQVYKFRSAKLMHFKALRQNKLYASTYKNLNDPFETLTGQNVIENWSHTAIADIRNYFIYGSAANYIPTGIRNLLDKEIDSLTQYQKRRRKKYPKRFERDYFSNGTSDASDVLQTTVNFIESSKSIRGIYSLSKNIYNELMWAHYSDSHQGFAIEFDLDKFDLDKFNAMRIEVQYSNQPQDINIYDLDCLESSIKMFLKKSFGYKSKAWEYEGEIRLIFTNVGVQYYPCTVVTGIYFGLRMKEKYKVYLQKIFQGSNITFYQIQHKKNSYELEAIPLNE